MEWYRREKHPQGGVISEEDKAMLVYQARAMADRWERRSIHEFGDFDPSAENLAITFDIQQIRSSYRALPAHAKEKEKPPFNIELFKAVIGRHDRHSGMDAVLSDYNRAAHEWIGAGGKDPRKFGWLARFVLKTFVGKDWHKSAKMPKPNI